jgi:hypothetical protein
MFSPSPIEELRSILHVFIIKIFLFEKMFIKYKRKDEKIFSLKRIIQYNEIFLNRIKELIRYLDSKDNLLHSIIKDMPVLETELLRLKFLLKKIEYAT